MGLAPTGQLRDTGHIQCQDVHSFSGVSSPDTGMCPADRIPPEENPRHKDETLAARANPPAEAPAIPARKEDRNPP